MSDDRREVRMACRQRRPLDGVDAQALEGALQQVELELEECKAENKELQAVFDLQETRTKKAEKMWQQATGKHSTLPDLGVLLDWLMGEVKRLKAMLAIGHFVIRE